MANIDLPRFPPEIEFQIFRLAIEDSFRDVPNLILVAHRVHEWLMPEVFKTVIVTHPKMFPLREMTSSTFEQYGIHVKHLCIAKGHYSPSNPEAEPFVPINQNLEHCPNLGNLFMGLDMPISTLLLIGGHPNLTQLTAPTMNLLNTLTNHWGLGSTKIAFPRITHLRLTYWLPEQVHIAALAHHFTALTHVAIPGGHEPHSEYEGRVKEMLERCPRLKIVVVWRDGELDIAREREEVSMRWDRRVVELFSAAWYDWEASARGTGLDIWEFGEKLLAERYSDPVL